MNKKLILIFIAYNQVFNGFTLINDLPDTPRVIVLETKMTEGGSTGRAIVDMGDGRKNSKEITFRTSKVILLDAYYSFNATGAMAAGLTSDKALKAYLDENAQHKANLALRIGVSYTKDQLNSKDFKVYVRMISDRLQFVVEKAEAEEKKTAAATV